MPKPKGRACCSVKQAPIRDLRAQYLLSYKFEHDPLRYDAACFDRQFLPALSAGITRTYRHDKSRKRDQHLYAVARSIVDEVAKSQANVVSRIFILQVTKSDCCDPISIGGHCFQCCDNPNHVICINYGTVGYIMGRIKAVSNNDWEQAQRTEFKEVKEWMSIAQQLENQPVQEVSPEGPDAKKFWEGTQL